MSMSHPLLSAPDSASLLSPGWRGWQARARGRLRALWRRDRIWLAPGAQSCTSPSAADRASGTPLWLGPDPADMLTAWAAWCEQHPGARCEIALSSHWVWTLTVPASEEGASAAQRVTEARAAWAEAMGVSPELLAEHLLWRALPAGEPALVCALPRGLADPLMAVAMQHGVSVERMFPWWLAAARDWWFGVRREPSPSEGHVVALEPGLVLHFEVDSDQGLVVWSERVPFGEVPHGLPVLARACAGAGPEPLPCLVVLPDAVDPAFAVRRQTTGGSA